MEWRIQKQDKERATDLSRTLAVSPVVAWVLLNRGLSEAEAARKFLAPSLEHLRPEQPMADMDQAVSRILGALEKGEIIGIHGDYDVDGVTGTALLVRLLTAFSAGRAKLVTYLPHRQREGYGMKPAGVEALYKKGARLILCVDCGVNDHEAIARAGELGLDVVVIDHHQVPADLPPAYAVLNPHRPDCPFRGAELSGVGTAFYLGLALRAKLREEGKLAGEVNLREYLDLVALGTIADVVPLTGWNRVLVYFGLQELSADRKPWGRQLKRVARLQNGPLSAGQVSFLLAPRLNAPGRLDSADLSLHLLLADNEREAGWLADKLEDLNRTRQRVEEQILAEATRQLEAEPSRSEAPAIVAAGHGWHLGVIGIVASRLAETYYRPAAVIGIHQGIAKGSLRSVPGINIYKVLQHCTASLSTFGGHPMAAGITLPEEMIPSFQADFTDAVTKEAPAEAFSPYLSVDAEWPISNCDRNLVNELAKLKPHGMGNPEPSFCARGIRVKWAGERRAETLLLQLEEKGKVVNAVGFRMSPRIPAPGERLDIVYTPIEDDYNGPQAIKLKIKDFKPVE